MEILNVSAKTSLNRNPDIIGRAISETAAKAEKRTFGSIAENITAFSSAVKKALSAAAFRLNKGSAALMLALAIGVSGFQLAVMPGAQEISEFAAQPTGALSLSKQQQQELFRMVENVEITDAQANLTTTEFKRYVAFKVLDKPKLRMLFDSHGIPAVGEIEKMAKESGVSGRINLDMIVNLTTRMREKDRNGVFSKLDEKHKAEAIRAASFDYYEDYEKDVQKRRDAGELNEFEVPLSKMVAQLFVKNGRVQSPDAGKDNKLTQRDIRAMWQSIQSNIDRVYENPQNAACDAAADVDCLAGGTCKVKTGLKASHKAAQR